MFLLVQLHMDSLCGKSTLRSLCQTLKKVPDGFKETYYNALARIDKQPEEQRKLAYQVLSWISYTFRPMSLVELQYEFLLSVCGGLVVIMEEHKQVTLVHKCITIYKNLSNL
jgi:hypothetical protein